MQILKNFFAKKKSKFSREKNRKFREKKSKISEENQNFRKTEYFRKNKKICFKNIRHDDCLGHKTT